MYCGKVAYIPVHIPTKVGLNWLKISQVIGHTLTSGQVIGPGRLLDQSLYSANVMTVNPFYIFVNILIMYKLHL